jgi:hypothetical protein
VANVSIRALFRPEVILTVVVVVYNSFKSETSQALQLRFKLLTMICNSKTTYVTLLILCRWLMERLCLERVS